jgi:hypothetical protein
MVPFFMLMVLVGNRHMREEENNGHSHSEPLYKDEESLEEDERGKEGGKTSFTPLWRFVTKLDRGKGVEPLNFYVSMIVIKEKFIPVHIHM